MGLFCIVDVCTFHITAYNIAAIFGIIYYILTRLIFTYRLQKHLAETIANYQFKWNLWFVDWRDEALQQAWTEKLQVLRKHGELTHQKHQKILHTYQQHSTVRWAYIGLFLLICVSTFLALLLTTTKSHHKLTDFNRNRRRTLTAKVPVFANQQIIQSHKITCLNIIQK